jgi:hypothetical protein
VSGLYINVNKSTALCINTDEALQEGLSQAGLRLTLSTKHLCLHLTSTLEDTISATMEQIHPKIHPKAIKRLSLAITTPTDILHHATLINIALLPVNNHVLMSLPIDKTYTDVLDTEVLKFLWTRQQDG